MSDTTTAALEKLVGNAGRLYSLPSVAMEVLRLTESETVDIAQLKEAIERDPALCAKLLRVVNSSLFGLRGKVSDLNQALALLGVEPLKMLVLGFSLPDELFAKMAGEPLRRYWTVSLTRAVCARRLAEIFPGVSGDQAFLAGLLRDIGLLVMVQQLGEPYLRFLELANDKPGRLFDLEQKSLGFDHTKLSAELMRDWRLPTCLSDAVEHGKPAREKEGQLSDVIELAELVLLLVLDKRLDVLPEMMERGAACCGLDKDQLRTLLEPLQARVDQLAEAMSVELTHDIDYQAVLTDAHALLAVTAESAVGMILSRKSDDELAEGLLAESHEVRLAMREFLRGAKPEAPTITRAEGAHPAPKMAATLPVVEIAPAARQRLVVAVQKLSRRCREERCELSVVVLLGEPQREVSDTARDEAFSSALQAAHESSQPDEVNCLPLDATHMAVLMPAGDRRTAVAYANAAVEEAAADGAILLKAGIASITLVPNRFEAERLVAGALSCLNATLTSGSTAVKSIEVY